MWALEIIRAKFARRPNHEPGVFSRWANGKGHPFRDGNWDAAIKPDRRVSLDTRKNDNFLLVVFIFELVISIYRVDSYLGDKAEPAIFDVYDIYAISSRDEPAPENDRERGQ